MFERTHIEPAGEYADEIRELAAQAAGIARPKAVYAVELWKKHGLKHHGDFA